MDRLRHPWVVRSCQIAVGLLFTWAALAKVGDLESFARDVHNFRMVPVAAENLLAMTLPWIELVAALALILNVRARAGAVVVAGLLVVFTVGVLVALVRGLDIACGCFGSADATRVGLEKILENVGMLVLAGVGSLRPR